MAMPKGEPGEQEARRTDDDAGLRVASIFIPYAAPQTEPLNRGGAQILDIDGPFGRGR